MSFEFTDLEQAQSTNGLYMTVVPGIPSPWTEAAKGILHIKNISWSAVRFDARDKAMRAWTQSRSAPTLMNEHDSPRSDWLEILHFAESHTPEPTLLPEEPALQQQALELCKLICAESGLGWNRRLQGVHSGLTGEGGFPEPIASYLGSKYGYDPEAGATYSQQVADQLGQLATVLQQQRSLGQPFYLGNRLTAVDIYSATFMAMFKPLPQTECPMLDPIRTVFESVDDRIQQALDPILLEHRDFIYREYLELPLKL